MFCALAGLNNKLYKMHDKCTKIITEIFVLTFWYRSGLVAYIVATNRLLIILILLDD
jgi:hypothetical protein